VKDKAVKIALRQREYVVRVAGLRKHPPGDDGYRAGDVVKLSEGITSLQENPGKVRIAAGINSKEDNVMSHFNDLCQINREAEEKRAEAAQILRDEAARLIDFYEEWLGLPSMYWEDDDGDLHRYVETGLPCKTAADFSPLSVHNIASAPDNIFRMAVRTWVKSSDSSYPVSVVIALELYSVDAERVSLRVRVEDDISVRVFINKPSEEAWGDVVMHMKKHIANHLKKRAPSALR
jgi:hypothetical protein